MNEKDYISMGLNGLAPLKLILCGEVEEAESRKTGVVSVVYATENKEIAEEKIKELSEKYPEKFYMVYSVPLNVDLTTLSHYPSIEISQEDLQ